MKKLKEYKTFGCHFTLYDEGIELHSMASSRFIRKDQIVDVTIKSFTSTVLFRIADSKEKIILSFSLKDVQNKESVRVGEYLQGKNGAEVFNTPEVSKVEVAQPTIEEKQEPEKISIGSSIVGLIAIIIIVFTAISVFSEVSNNPGPTKTQVTETEVEDYSDLDSAAYIVSKKYIESILKSPSTADFPFLDYTATHYGDGRYRVTSYVDSENSFGAMIRSDWTILMTYKKEGSDTAPSSWELEEVVFEGKVMYP